MSAATKEFLRVLNDLDRSKHRGEVFADFCELAFCALAKKASPSESQRDQLEVQYMDVVRRYRNKDDIRRMPELLALAAGEIGAGGCDFLGQVAGEMGALDAKLGQFFTPYEVSRFMAEMNLIGVEEKIRAQGFITVQEPAAGAGGMLMAVADVIEAKGFELETSVWIEATELSRSTFQMCYLQCAARGLAGKIICGNSLSLETYCSAYTAAAHVFFGEHGDPFAKQRAAWEVEEQANVEREKRRAKERSACREALHIAEPASAAVQLGLFD